ncbi:2-oxo-4-hydroxy-4-carboxy-5-ureidoimidazoline decarboxylase [Haloferula sp.]|uniref:2-oxo-4-hydroxy-4-carboxy-5-ureidoimidazoline decarboxylase n=1 Tax=Haloferula sp. TaxID=2497595 RepID=UPI003C784E92
MTPLSKLNDFSRHDFVNLLGGIYEHSPWIAEAAHSHAPFESIDTLLATLRETVDTAPTDKQLALIRAHPDLGGKLARAGALTAESTREQAGLGLDRLSDDEFEQLTDLNTRYRERFGFPFIICARLTTKDGVIKSFTSRLNNTATQEVTEALQQIHHIARLRLEDLVSG